MATYPLSALRLVPTNQHTLNHEICPACERARLMTLSKIDPASTFSFAAEQWITSRSFRVDGATQARYLRKPTELSYRAYIRSLNLWFGETPLNKIHVGMLRGYQEARVQGLAPFIRYRRPQDAKARVVGGVIIPAKGKTPCPASPKKVNQKLTILKMILRRAGCW